MKKVALVHDYLTQYGGAERVLSELCLMFPDAPIYTILYDEEKTEKAFADRVIRASFLQKLPYSTSVYRTVAFLMPFLVEQFDLSDYDVVISSSASFGKGVLTRENTKHICYCHTPTRFLWGDYKNIAGKTLYPKFLSWLIPIFLPYLRVWDISRIKNVDHFICNSNNTKNKIKRYYNRDSKVIYPPVNIDNFNISDKKEYFLIVGRMLPYKRFDIAVEACSKLNLPLFVVGEGPEYKKLRKIAGSSVKFLGRVPEEDLPELYSNSKAFVAPQNEDFGISAIESLASGKPVISYKAGGALEYITEEENGIFFEEQNVDSLCEALIRFDKISFDSEKIRDSALRFSKKSFSKNFLNTVEKLMIK